MRADEMSVLFSFSKLLEQKEQLEQKHLHLLQILDSERQSKWQYVQQTDELAAEVRKLKTEVYCMSGLPGSSLITGCIVWLSCATVDSITNLCY